MCGPLPGTKVRRHGAQAPTRGRVSGARRTAAGASGRREARGAGVLTERSEAERASTRRPEESLSAWSREPARTRGRPAPQRRSALHADTAGAKAPRRLRRPWFEPGFKDPTPKRSEAERGVGSEPATGAATASATDVTWLIYTHIFHYPHSTSAPGSPPPLTESGGGDPGARVCVGARARARLTDSGKYCKRKTVRLFTE